MALTGRFDVVITTFRTLAMEWKGSNVSMKHSSSITDSLFSVLWHRVILDEGENIFSAILIYC